MPDMKSWKQRGLAAVSQASQSSQLQAIRGHLSQQNIHAVIPERRALQPGERGYVEGKQQSWTQWAGQKITAARGSTTESDGSGVEGITLFPGWATRRYHKSVGGKIEDSFGMDVFVSGYAYTSKPPEFATRSQKAFLRLARGFASLPKIQTSQPGATAKKDPAPKTPFTRSTEDLMASVQLPPRPLEIQEDFESKQVANMEEQFKRMQAGDLEEEHSGISRSSSSSSLANMDMPHPPSMVQTAGSAASNFSSDLIKLNANLESRLQPFWSTALASRKIRLSLFASSIEPALTESAQKDDKAKPGLDHGPVAIQEVVTGPDGAFQAKFTIPWEEMCTHPGALHIAFGDPTHEHDLLITSEVIPGPKLPQRQNSMSGSLAPPPATSTPVPTLQTLQRVSLTHSPIRVISDIDDTVKMSNISSGARAVFYNVFVKEYKDIVIPGMGEWYNEMWQRGVRFHYVSNGPFELIPVVIDFFEVSKLPPGSVKLKSYAGRSLFNGLLSAPAARKRAGIIDILDSFPDSRFILVGDTGEQDLELYSTVGRERPHQILAVFVRDVEPDVNSVDDPTGAKISQEPAIPGPGGSRDLTAESSAMDDAFMQAMAGPKTPMPRMTASPDPMATPTALARPDLPKRSLSALATTIVAKAAPKQMRTLPPSVNSNPSNGTDNDYFTPNSRAASPVSRSNSNEYDSGVKWTVPGGMPPTEMTEAQKKRYDLQMRVYRARSIIPTHIPLRIFRSPEECGESMQILDQLHVGNTQIHEAPAPA